MTAQHWIKRHKCDAAAETAADTAAAAAAAAGVASSRWLTTGRKQFGTPPTQRCQSSGSVI